MTVYISAISSVYHPIDAKEYLKFNNYISSNYDSTPKSYFMTSRQDINASIGSREMKSCKQIGPHGINNRNAKGAEAVNLLRMHDLYAPLTFYCHKEKVIWSSFDGKNTKFQLDQWITK